MVGETWSSLKDQRIKVKGEGDKDLPHYHQPSILGSVRTFLVKIIGSLKVFIWKRIREVLKSARFGNEAR
jgi:hypothetical protein